MCKKRKVFENRGKNCKFKLRSPEISFVFVVCVCVCVCVCVLVCDKQLFWGSKKGRVKKIKDIGRRKGDCFEIGKKSGRREHWTVNNSGTQSFIILFVSLETFGYF